MRNERLRSTLLQRGITPEQLAAAISVDQKSVERWIAGRNPYRRHRYAVAAYLGVDEVFLWPDALSPHQIANASESEIISVYPHRWTVPSDMWRNFFDAAERESSERNDGAGRIDPVADRCYRAGCLSSVRLSLAARA